jgi:hypothetical protein
MDKVLIITQMEMNEVPLLKIDKVMHVGIY